MKIAHIAKSKNGLTIRLTAERWCHITEEHCELAGMREEILETIQEPELILSGSYDELLAVKPIEDKKYLVVVYRETNDDGFVITAFFTKRYRSLTKRRQVWP